MIDTTKTWSDPEWEPAVESGLTNHKNEEYLRKEIESPLKDREEDSDE